jgi:hypothetical protein
MIKKTLSSTLMLIYIQCFLLNWQRVFVTWRVISKQNYWDSSALFLIPQSTMFSSQLILHVSTIVILYSEFWKKLAEIVFYINRWTVSTLVPCHKILQKMTYCKMVYFKDGTNCVLKQNKCALRLGYCNLNLESN